MNNIFENLGFVDGTGEMTPRQVKELGTVLPSGDTVKVLEFGSGNSTTKLCRALETKYKKVTYVTYETSQQWAINDDPIIETRMHTRDELVGGSIKIPEDEVYDLVIVDGPDGELRQHWYQLFKNNVKKGTVVHIDDAFHYTSFETEFKKHFPQTEDLFRVKLGEGGGNKCWITAKIL
jgi:predicted O-methyltransferase YrrM